MTTTRRFAAYLSAAALLALAAAAPAAGQTLTWPQRITAPEGTIDVYQPQFDTLKGNAVTGRAAVGLTASGSQAPVFGAFWFSGIVDVDRDADEVVLRHIAVTRVRWPDMTPELEQRFRTVVERAVPGTGLQMSFERFSASLATAERERLTAPVLNNDPPAIVFAEQLSVLLLFDGDPVFRAIENSTWERALNTPFALVRDTRSRVCYLTSGPQWYTARDPLGPWTPTSSPPADLVANMPKDDSGEPAPKVPPRIVVATRPTELIVSDGPPAWRPLPSGKLLFVENTETPWLRDLDGQQIYVLLSGRWFKAASTAGPWTFAPADQLPPAFRAIPSGSDIGGVRVSVAGTEEADDAMLDAVVPQTTAIKRDGVTFDAVYDGRPAFERIPGTSVSWATNTEAQIIQVGDRFFAADNGVWFVSTSASGPWSVATEVPEQEIQQIPPSSPVYNITHLHIYQSTPQVVVVGYTPGYRWSFPCHGVPVFGTGFHHPAFFGTVFIPRPPTWGFHMTFHPWWGWNVGMTWSSGFFRFGVGWNSGWGTWGRGPMRPMPCCGGWGGVASHRRPIVINNTGNINIGNRVNIGNRGNVGNVGNRPGGARPLPANIGNNRFDNIYNRPENRPRIADRAAATGNLRAAAPATGRANNVFAYRDGNVARRIPEGWQARGANGWERAVPANIRQPAAPAGAARPGGAAGGATAGQLRQRFDSVDLNRAAAARDRGVVREANRPNLGALRQGR
jgi:Cu/Ag efflux protein CusF